MACLRMVYQDAVIVWCLGVSASVPQHTAALHAMQYVQTELHVTSAACELDMNATCVVIVDLVVFALCLHMTHVTACQADLHVASRMRQGKTVCSSTRWLSAACQAAALLYLLCSSPQHSDRHVSARRSNARINGSAAGTHARHYNSLSDQ